MLSLKEEEKITSVIPVRSFAADRYLLMATRRGLVKKTALEEYSRKRDFQKTPEPAPEKVTTREGSLTFVVQKHAASRLHYDFRL